ncbi:hypothetical protein PQX77_016667 [Marasmius sp. AFHP31]|nr:hypothetical protein PQX77_016667 [Marasmius sp. AFHP31]
MEIDLLSNADSDDFARVIPGLNSLEGKLVALQSFALISGHRCILCDESMFCDIRPGLAPHLVATFTNIIELKVRLQSEDLATFVAFICSFPRLQVLRVRISMFVDFVQHSTAKLTDTLPLTVKSIIITERDGNIPGYVLTQRFHHWLETHPPRPITLLSIVDYHNHESISSPNPSPYFTGLCKDTKTLHLSFNCDWDQGGEMSSIYNVYITNRQKHVTLAPPTRSPPDLSTLTSLERIVLSFRGYTSETFSLILHIILHMVNTTTSPHFRAIVFHFINDNGSGFPTEFGWSELDDLLATDKFATCSVELIIPPDENEVCLFPKLHQRGRVTVVRAPSSRPAEKQMEWVCNRR